MDRPTATRDARTQTMPFLACAARAATAAWVRLPLPTPAITRPLAPAATAASISAPSMFLYAMMMSTRGSAVTPLSENSDSLVCLATGLRLNSTFP